MAIDRSQSSASLAGPDELAPATAVQKEHSHAKGSKKSIEPVQRSPLDIEVTPQSLALTDTMSETFQKCWKSSTADSNLTLHGFRRFKTTHLMNLRLLEHEIARMDHIVYQAGLSLGTEISRTDRLSLKHTQKDVDVPDINDVITTDFVLKLRNLLKEYGEYLAS